MPKISETYTSNSQWLKADDLKGQAVIVTIESTVEVQMEERDGKPAHKKIEVSFPGSEKALLLNKTNAAALSGMFGDDTDAWTGKSFEMFPTPVKGPNGMTTGIRVKPVAQAAPPAAAPPAGPDVGDGPGTSGLPF